MTLKTIWDNSKLWGDSVVLSDGKKCFKMYSSKLYTLEWLDFYQECQNSLQWFTLTHYQWLEMGLSKRIKTIRVEFLFLSSEKHFVTDIKTWEKKIVSEVMYQDGKTLAEVIGYNDYQSGYIKNIVSLLSYIQADIMKQLQVDMSTSEKLKNNIPMQFQINPNNIKVADLDIDKQTIRLVVTDIAMMIDGFIQKNKEKIKSNLL